MSYLYDHVDVFSSQMCNISYLSSRLDLLLTLRELPITMEDLEPVRYTHAWRHTHTHTHNHRHTDTHTHTHVYVKLTCDLAFETLIRSSQVNSHTHSRFSHTSLCFRRHRCMHIHTLYNRCIDTFTFTHTHTHTHDRNDHTHI